jgi:hypothetical protein
MLTIPRRGAERISTFSEIPETLLIIGTSVGADDDEFGRKRLKICLCHFIECIFGFFSDEISPTCLIDVCSRDRYEIFWSIATFSQRSSTADESIYVVILVEISELKWFFEFLDF